MRHRALRDADMDRHGVSCLGFTGQSILAPWHPGSLGEGSAPCDLGSRYPMAMPHVCAHYVWGYKVGYGEGQQA